MRSHTAEPSLAPTGSSAPEPPPRKAGFARERAAPAGPGQPFNGWPTTSTHAPSSC